MNRLRHLRIYDLHSWTGIALGLLVFVVSYTGVPALFHDEFHVWEDPAARLDVPADPVSADAVIRPWIEKQAGEDEIAFLRVGYPTRYQPFLSAFLRIQPEGRPFRDIEARWNAQTGALLPERGDGGAHLLYDLHRDLAWPDALGGRTVGRAIVGIVGIVLALSILTGVVAHTRITRDLFALRWHRSVRLKWQDTHKVFGLWGLPFYGMISLTGAFLGVIVLLAPVIALIAFKGDQETLLAEVIGSVPDPAGVAAPMLALDQIWQMRHAVSGEAPLFVVLNNWGDQNALFDVYFRSETVLRIVDVESISGVTGTGVPNPVVDVDGPADRVTAAVTPLHYGTFGGIALKALYAVLGLSLAIITALGSMMWIERRLHGNEGGRSIQFYRFLSKLTVGVCMGLVLATPAVLIAGRIYSGPEDMRYVWMVRALFIVWFAGLGYAFVRANEYGAVREMLGATGMLFLVAPLVNVVLTGNPLEAAFTGNGHGLTSIIDLTLAGLGLALLILAPTLPRARQGHTRQSGTSARAG